MGVAGEVVEGGLVCAGCCVQARGAGRIWGVEFGQPGAQQVVVGVGAQQGMLQPAVGDPVAADFRDAFDDAVDAEPAPVVGRLSGGDVLGSGTEVGAQITVGEPVREQPWMSRAGRSA